MEGELPSGAAHWQPVLGQLELRADSEHGVILHVRAALHDGAVRGGGGFGLVEEGGGEGENAVKHGDAGYDLPGYEDGRVHHAELVFITSFFSFRRKILRSFPVQFQYLLLLSLRLDLSAPCWNHNLRRS